MTKRRKIVTYVIATVVTVTGVTFLERTANHGWGVSFLWAVGSYAVGSVIGYIVGQWS